MTGQQAEATPAADDAGNQNQQAAEQQRPMTFMEKFWHEWVVPIVPVVLVLLAFRSAVADWNDVPTGSMKPTIMIGDRIFVNKLAYDVRVPFAGWRVYDRQPPLRGDIVVFFAPDEADEHAGVRMVKRVVGLPGDTISIRGNRLTINGEPVEYEPVEPETILSVESDASLDYSFYIEHLPGGRSHIVKIGRITGFLANHRPIKLGENEYFMMGDNRDHSSDSRRWGPVHRDAIVGQATRVMISREDDSWDPAWERFLHPLN